MQTSVIELTGAFYAWILMYWTNGWSPNKLWWLGQKWDKEAINDLEDSYGQEWSWAARQKLEIAGQTAFFVGIVVCQIGNVIACKTRRQSLLQKGMR
jgi:sodium/potassium-transporting ATPase subunit alpha